MSSIFLSHSSRDRLFARRLAKALSENGVRVWIDEAEIKAGDRLLNKLNDGVRSVDFLGVLLSPASVSSSWVLKEVEIAGLAHREGKQIKIIPILHKDCEMPECLQDHIHVDFRCRNHFRKALTKLLDAILPEGFHARIIEVVRKAIQAEFAAYKQLPVIDLHEIDTWYVPDGSARARIALLLQRHKERGWIISNPGNPSTIEIIDVQLKKVQNDTATVNTAEYWYLRWFNPENSKYHFIYNQTNTQTYVLTKDSAGNWRISLNSYPVTPPPAEANDSRCEQPDNVKETTESPPRQAGEGDDGHD